MSVDINDWAPNALKLIFGYWINEYFLIVVKGGKLCFVYYETKKPSEK